MFHHPTCFRAVKVELIARATVGCGNHKRLVVGYEADVTDQPCVQNVVDVFALVSSALRKSFQSCARGGIESRHLESSLVDYRVVLRSLGMPPTRLMPG